MDELLLPLIFAILLLAAVLGRVVARRPRRVRSSAELRDAQERLRQRQEKHDPNTTS
jgi:hypothetical protein